MSIVEPEMTSEIDDTSPGEIGTRSVHTGTGFVPQLPMVPPRAGQKNSELLDPLYPVDEEEFPETTNPAV